MRKWGISPKQWFYGFRDELRARGNAVRARLAGAAAEQWLNAEFFAFLSNNLSRGFYPYPEWRKRDLAIFRRHPDYKHTDSYDSTEAIIETKVFYRGYGETKTTSYVRTLARQLSHAQRLMAADGNPHGMCVGLLFGAYVKWDERFDRRQIRSSPREFTRESGATIRRVARESGLAVAKDAMETFVNVDETSVGGERIEVGLFGQYVVAP